jgi:DNA-binding transcriptional regulator YiaG
MIDLNTLKDNPELAQHIRIETNGASLIAFAECLIDRTITEMRKLQQSEAEEYLTPQQFADVIGITLVTLWNWDKRGITKPLHVGNKKRYRRSDLEKIMETR